MKLSPYVSRIQRYFNLQIVNNPAIPDVEHQVLPYVGTKLGTLHHLIQVAQNTYKDNLNLSPDWAGILRYLTNDSEVGRKTANLLKSIHYKNVPKKLDDQIITGLYGSELNISISQLERTSSKTPTILRRMRLESETT